MEIVSDPSNAIDIPMILGYNSNEGLMPLADCHKNSKYQLFDQDLACRIPRSIALAVDDPRNAELADEIRQFYFGGQKITDQMKASVAHLLGDFHFVIELHLLAEIYARRQHKWVRFNVPVWNESIFNNVASCPMYFYKLDCEEELNVYKRLLIPDVDLNEEEHKTLTGGSHGDDIYFLFEWVTIACTST